MFVPNFTKIERGPDFFLLIWYGMTLTLLTGTVKTAETIQKALSPNVFDTVSHSPSDITQPPTRSEFALKPTAG